MNNRLTVIIIIITTTTTISSVQKNPGEDVLGRHIILYISFTSMTKKPLQNVVSSQKRHTQSAYKSGFSL